jgi:hypothetical protein
MRHRSIYLPSLFSLFCAVTAHAQIPAYQLQAARDSFEIRIQGRPMGFTVLAVETHTVGFRVTERTQLGTAVEQNTEILLDRQQRLMSVRQNGRMRGQDARIAIEYGHQHVRGTALIPTPAGSPDSLHIDTHVPADVIDDNLLQTVLAFLPWTADAQWTLPVFSAGKNQVTQRTLKVTNVEESAYRVELQGGEMPLTFWVSRSAPHRVVKLSSAQGAFEMVRVN